MRNTRQHTEKLNVAVDILKEKGALPSEYLPHKLSGNWGSSMECHIQPDLLLIYDINDEEVILHRCGSHAKLFNQ